MPEHTPQIESPTHPPETFSRTYIRDNTAFTKDTGDERKADNHEAFIENIALDLLCGKNIREIRMRAKDDIYAVLGDVEKYFIKFQRHGIENIMRKIMIAKQHMRMKRKRKKKAPRDETHLQDIRTPQIDETQSLSFPENLFGIPYAEAKKMLVDAFTAFYVPQIHERNAANSSQASHDADIMKNHFKKLLEDIKETTFQISFPDALLNVDYKTAKAFVLDQFISQYTQQLISNPESSLKKASKRAGIDRGHFQRLMRGEVGRGIANNGRRRAMHFYKR